MLAKRDNVHLRIICSFLHYVVEIHNPQDCVLTSFDNIVMYGGGLDCMTDMKS
jgi:hypothetical protein